MFRIVGDTKINFIGARKYSFMLSVALVAVGVTAFIMIATGNANLGIDFAGGIMVYGHFEEPVQIEDLRAAVATQFPDAMITQLTGFELPNAFMIKVKRPETEAQGKERVETLKALVQGAFAGNQFGIESEHIIGPAVGETLRRDARWAVLLSLFGIIVYIWIRFDFRSGIAATIATFHDVLAVLGITWLLNIEFDLLLVTALLTLAGYSLTDTVVVYDRIRENLKKYRTKSDFAPAVNMSINDVLSRTIMTSLTTLLVVSTLFILGGEVLRTFSLALIMGVLVGTYSSVFVASPIVVEWEARHPKRFR